jgi:hypothetical protein
MANRATEADVEKLLDVDSDIDVDAFITEANALIEQVLSSAGYTEAYLTIIETNLAAHFVALHPRMRQLTQEKFGDATQTFGGKFGDQLKFTQFGQKVLQLDTSGVLAKTGKIKMMLEAL